MNDFCKTVNSSHIKIPFEHSPRATFPILFFTMVKALKHVFPFDESDIHNSLEQLDLLSKKISSNNLNDSNPSLNLAKWISNTPLIYYPSGLHPAAIRFKASLQENAKLHVILEEILEACHNNIVAWENPSNVQPILLRGKDDHVKTLERWEILKEFFDSKQIPYWEIQSISGGIISKLIHLIYMLDYASIYKAILSEIDPTPINPIDFVKNRLNYT